jgi:hypothetical protein
MKPYGKSKRLKCGCESHTSGGRAARAKAAKHRGRRVGQLHIERELSDLKPGDMEDDVFTDQESGITYIIIGRGDDR